MGRAGQSRGWLLRRDAGDRVGGRDLTVNRIIKRMAVPVGAAIILGSSGFAFMATNSVPLTHAGSGDNTISGYTVSGVSYNYVDDDSDPDLSYIKSVTFTLDHAANQVSAHIKDGTRTSAQPWVPYDSCVTSNNYTWTCSANTGSNADLAYQNGTPAASILHVSAAQ